MPQVREHLILGRGAVLDVQPCIDLMAFWFRNNRPSLFRQVPPTEDPDPAYQVRPGEADRSRAESGVRAAAAGGGDTRATSPNIC